MFYDVSFQFGKKGDAARLSTWVEADDPDTAELKAARKVTRMRKTELYNTIVFGPFRDTKEAPGCLPR